MMVVWYQQEHERVILVLWNQSFFAVHFPYKNISSFSFMVLRVHDVAEY
jgi:hypothetical protein